MKIRQAKKILNADYPMIIRYKKKTFLKADKTYKKYYGFKKWSELL